MSKIFLDAGHGGKDPGAIGNGLQEKNITLPITLKIGETLEKYGIKVAYSRTADTFVGLSERAKKANNVNANIFVSIHCNSATNTTARGVETYSYPGSVRGVKLAKTIQNSIVSAKIFSHNRGIKTANFAVLRETKMPSVLVELGFISNSQDAQLLKSKQDEICKAVAKGILNYLGVKFVSNKKHWAEKYYESLRKKGIKIHEKRFDDKITRGEVFALLDRVVSLFENISN